jgi:tetratricopeptide (TPR) repeat protein
MGKVYIALGAYEDALTPFDIAIRVNPTNREAWIGKARAADRVGNPEMAREAYAGAQKIGPSPTDAQTEKDSIFVKGDAKAAPYKPEFFDSKEAQPTNSLVGHWVCSSVQMPTGLFLFRTFDFYSNGTFRSIDSLQARPPVRVMEGSWEASPNTITLKYRTWRIGSEETVDSSEAYVGYGFIDSSKSAFEITFPLPRRPSRLYLRTFIRRNVGTTPFGYT